MRASVKTSLATLGSLTGLLVGASAASAGTIGGEIDKPRVHTSSAVGIGEEPWTLDLPAISIPGVTTSAPFAIPPHDPMPVEVGRAGIERSEPVSFDWVAAHRRAAEQAANEAALRESAHERTEDWQRSRGLLCDPTNTTPSLAHLCTGS